MTAHEWMFAAYVLVSIAVIWVVGLWMAYLEWRDVRKWRAHLRQLENLRRLP